MKVSTKKIEDSKQKAVLFDKFIEGTLRNLAFVARYDWVFIPRDLEAVFRKFADFKPNEKAPAQEFEQIGKLYACGIVVNEALPPGVLVLMDTPAKESDKKEFQPRKLEIRYML